MRILAWVTLIVSCVFALGSFLIFVDLLVVHLFTANAEMYESWAWSYSQSRPVWQCGHTRPFDAYLRVSP